MATRELVLTDDTTGKVPSSKLDLPFVSLADFGIVGDGTTNHTAALQQVLDNLTAGTVLTCPPGVYIHDGLDVVSKDRVSIIGNQATFLCTSRTRQYWRFLTCTNIAVSGIESSAFNSDLSRQGVTRAFSFEDCENIVVTGNTVKSAEGVGIYLETSHNARIQGNSVSNTWADGCHMIGGSTTLTVTGNEFNNVGDDAISVVSYRSKAICENFTISGNTVNKSHARGITVVGGKDGSIGANTIRDTRSSGIYVNQEDTYETHGVSNVAITGNSITRSATVAPVVNQAGIMVSCSDIAYPVTGINISGNNVFDAGYDGILVGGGNSEGTYDITLSNNKVINANGFGYLIQRANGVTITGNTLNGCLRDGLTLINTVGVAKVIGNTITNSCTDQSRTHRRGILINSQVLTDCDVVSNTVDDPQTFVTTAIEYANSTNVTPLGNKHVQGNSTSGFSAATSKPINMPSSALMCGAHESSGLGGGTGVIGIRNASTVPSSNPYSGVIAYSEGGRFKVRQADGTVHTLGDAAAGGGTATEVQMVEGGTVPLYGALSTTDLSTINPPLPDDCIVLVMQA